MRIAWFTPLSKRSAIGEFSVHVAATLAEHAQVQLWCADEAPLHATDLEVVSYTSTSENLGRLAEADVIVYNIGDYLPFHREMIHVAERHPGVVILHDRVLHHLFAGMWLSGERKNRQRYADRMRAYYGEAGLQAAATSLEGKRVPVWESDVETLSYPLYEEGILGAEGVITHSSEHARQVEQVWLGPVAALQLPCYTEVLDRAAQCAAAVGASSSPERRVELLTIGHLNPNKQVHRVIEALAADSELARSVRYRVVGPDDGFRRYVEEMRDQIARHPQLNVELLGWAPESDLHTLMCEADLFINLRHPVMEGGSASVMRQLAYGRPILCFNSGLFHELPGEALARVPAGDFDAAANALGELVRQPGVRAAVGERARSVAETYDERRYVSGLLELLKRSRRTVPALRFLDSVARELGSMHVDLNVATYDEIADDFSRILAL